MLLLKNYIVLLIFELAAIYQMRIKSCHDSILGHSHKASPKTSITLGAKKRNKLIKLNSLN